jgi:hypothetical protein
MVIPILEESLIFIAKREQVVDVLFATVDTVIGLP